MRFATRVIDMIKPQGYAKPEVEVDGYALKWNDVSYGMPEREVAELKTFIRDAIPALVSIHRHAELLTREGERRTNLRRFQLEGSLATGIVASHSRSGARYEIYMAWDGMVFMDRTECINGNYDDGSGAYYDSQLEIRWNLGELYKQASVEAPSEAP